MKNKLLLLITFATLGSNLFAFSFYETYKRGKEAEKEMDRKRSKRLECLIISGDDEDARNWVIKSGSKTITELEDKINAGIPACYRWPALHLVETVGLKKKEDIKKNLNMLNNIINILEQHLKLLMIKNLQQQLKLLRNYVKYDF